MNLLSKNKPRKKELFSVPKSAYWYLCRGEKNIWRGERNHLVRGRNIVQDNDFIGYAKPIGCSDGIHRNPQSGIKCLFRADLIRSIDYVYFEKWHKELGGDWTLKQLLEDEENGISHLGKVGFKVTIKPTDGVATSKFLTGLTPLALADGEIVECQPNEAQIKGKI